MSCKRGLRKRGQLTIFVIIAIIIVAGVLAYFLVRNRLGIGGLSAKFQPIEQYFLSCIQEQAELGVGILGSQAGYIALPEFEPGSEYRPFSSQLDFLGTPIPYWYYVAGNNIIKEQVPTKTSMQNQLNKFVKENLDCDFSQFRLEGYEINMNLKDVKTTINDNLVSISVSADLEIALESEQGKQSSHKLEVQNNLGKMYGEALKIYNYEKQKAFLEDYAVDVLRLYAPVDGVEISCAPKIWLKENVDRDLKQALEANMGAIKFGSRKNYFVQNLDVSDSVNFLYSGNWPTRIEVWDANNGVMLAEPVGLQQGLGILGFCYVPYHFVYDINYPVLIQIYNENELFQFPVAVVIEKNKQRNALPVTGVLDTMPELCKYNNKDVAVYTYNNNLNPVEADISFSCLSQSCDIGKTKLAGNDAKLEERFPACVNGFIVARADGYANKKYMISTNEESVANIILDKEYDLDLDLKVNGASTTDFAIVYFDGENPVTLAWPEQKSLSLSEGAYNLSVYVYKKGGITIPGMNKEFCSDVPKSGLAGVLGMTEEKCFQVNLPGQNLENVISAGGKSSDYFVESQLASGKMEIRTNSIKTPASLEELQDSYNLVEASSIYINFEE